jgi:UDP-glucuronate 4-epimerase
MRWSEQCVLVTGSSGFIGAHLCRALLGCGARVVGLDNLDPFYSVEMKRRAEAQTRAHPNASRYASIVGDATDAPGLERVLRAHGVTGVIHLAAKAGVRPSIEDPVGYAHANVTGTASVLHASGRCGVSRVVCASSSSVYGNNTRVPFSEEDGVEHPISPYAATKRACELLAQTHHHLTGLPIAMLRFFTVYGPGQRPDLAIAKFMRLAREGRPIPMFGNGQTSRDYTYVEDIVAGICAAYERVPAHGYRVWNLGGNHPVTLHELIEAIGRVVGSPLGIEHQPAQTGDVERTWADQRRSFAELGYAPAWALEAGLRRQWEAFLSEPIA